MLQWTFVCFFTSAATTELCVKFIMSTSTDKGDTWIVWLSCEFCGRSISFSCTFFALNVLFQGKHLTQNNTKFPKKVDSCPQFVRHILLLTPINGEQCWERLSSALTRQCSGAHTLIYKNEITRKKKHSSSKIFKLHFSYGEFLSEFISLWISQFSNQVGLSWLKHCLVLDFTWLKTIM